MLKFLKDFVFLVLVRVSFPYISAQKSFEVACLSSKPSYFFPGNYSVAGFELTLRRKVSHYIITYYLPSGMFVIVSWISFLVPPEIVPGRMTLLVTVFLVLVNIFNTITSNIPKAEGLTAIEAWVIVCVLFVFGALIEYAGLLLKMKLEVSKSIKPKHQKCALKKMDDKRTMYINQCKKQREETSHARLDILFLLLFPIFFLCFNLIYWLSFLYYRPFSSTEEELACENC